MVSESIYGFRRRLGSLCYIHELCFWSTRVYPERAKDVFNTYLLEASVKAIAIEARFKRDYRKGHTRKRKFGDLHEENEKRIMVNLANKTYFVLVVNQHDI